MTEDTADTDVELIEQIHEEAAEHDDLEIVSIDESGPRIEVILDSYATVDGQREVVDTTLYAVGRDPFPEQSGDGDNPFAASSSFHWHYLGSVDPDAVAHGAASGDGSDEERDDEERDDEERDGERGTTENRDEGERSEGGTADDGA